MDLVPPGDAILVHGHQLLSVEARRNGAVRQQELMEVRLEHLEDEAVARFHPYGRFSISSIHLPHHVQIASADGRADDRRAPVLEALPINQQCGLGVLYDP